MIYLLILTLVVAFSTVAYGLVQRAKGTLTGKKNLKRALRVNLSTFVPVVAGAIIMMVPDIVKAAGDASAAASGAGMGYLAAGLSTGLACIGAGYAVGAVGSSALGAVSEDQSILGKTLIFVGLAEGIAIYGLIISIMILSRI